MTSILGPDGKPRSSKTRTAVEINVHHKPANQPAVQKIRILMAEVDGDLFTINTVLDGAKQKILEALAQIGAIQRPPGN